MKDDKICRICYQDSKKDLIAPCKCKGSIKYIHRLCLEEWRRKSVNFEDKIKCRICNHKYIFEGENRKELKLVFGYTLLFLTFFLCCAFINFFIFVVGKISLMLFNNHIYLFSYQNNVDDNFIYFYSVYLIICFSGMYYLSKIQLPILFIFINFNFQTGCMIFFLTGLLYLIHLFSKGLRDVRKMIEFIINQITNENLKIKDLSN